jgi:hypothetical protein
MTNIVSINRADFSLEQLMSVAHSFAKSGYFDKCNTPEQAFTKIMMGRSLGLDLFESIASVSVIKGKPVLAAVMMAAKIRGSGTYDYEPVEHTDQGCAIRFFKLHKDGTKVELGVASFTAADATRAGLMGGENYKKFPSDMYFARAISRGQKRFCPDVFNGIAVYTPGELDEETPPASAASNGSAARPNQPANNGATAPNGASASGHANAPANGQSNAKADRTPGEKPPVNASAPATGQQLNQLVKLATRAGYDTDTLEQKIAEAFQDTTLATLTQQQAVKIIKRLEATITKKAS